MNRTVNKKKQRHKLSAAHVMALGFFLIILTGALLLMLPIASQDGTVTPFFDTLFTATSATCVTGLVVYDTGMHWTLFGQAVIVVLIQLGGLGFMSFALLLTGFFGKRVSPRIRNITAQSFGLFSMEHTRQFVCRIFIGTMVIEGTGALLLMIRTIPMFGIGRGIFYGVFLAVSAFCNAGFDPLGGVTPEFASLTTMDSDPLMLLVLAFLIMFGSAGFLIWNDLWEWLTKRRRISVYCRFVVTITASVILSGTVLFALLEWNNPATLGELPVWKKIVQCFFQAVTPRTAGFDAIGQTNLTECSRAITIILMLIGGASGSTAGGVKISTFGVLLCTIWTTLKGRREIHVMKRKITEDTVRNAFCILCCFLAFTFIFALLITVFDDVPLGSALFECVSAFCTVGLSLSLTPLLGAASKVLLIISMYLGRVGILTLSYVLLHADREEDAVTYPQAKLLIG